MPRWRASPKEIIIALLLALSVSSFVGCSHPQVAHPPPVTQAGPQREILPEKLPELTVSQIEQEKREPKKLFTLALRDADLKDVLFALSQQLDYSIVMDPGVSGKITVDLKSVSLEELLDSILTPLGVEYELTERFIRVMGKKLTSRIFRLSYLTSKRTGDDTISATAGGGGGGAQAGVAGGGAAGGGAAGGGAAGGGGGGRGGGGGSFSSIDTEDEADLWEDIEDGLEDLISTEGKFAINKMGGAIMVTDYRSNLNKIATFLEEIEGSVHRQVYIQAKILEVTLSDKFQYGVDWAGIGRLGRMGPHPSFSIRNILQQNLGTGFNFFQLGFGNNDFSVLIDAISMQGEVNIISNPQIAALSNQTAIITVGTKDVFFQQTQTQTEAGIVTTATSPAFVTVGVVLYVTPQIGPDGLITMVIHPSISEKTGTVSSPGLGEVPIVDVRETETVVKVEDGQTIVIAGLMQDKKIKNQTSVPILGNIPILGALFRQSVEEKKKTELVILLTPTIAVGTGAQI